MPSSCLKTMFAQGLLAVDETSGEWTALSGAVAGGREFPVSQTVHDVIAERVERLPEQLNEVLITVAVAGAGCRTEVLSHVHGISRLHAAAVGDALVDRRLVVEEGGIYRCAHPVIAHVVRDGLSASRGREVHRTLALALERWWRLRRAGRWPARSPATPTGAESRPWPTASR